jgi:hypothetical protein
LGGAKADLASISPGLLFVALGVFLIGYAIYVEKEVHFSPSPISVPAAPDVKVPTGSPFGHKEQTADKEGKEDQAHEAK